MTTTDNTIIETLRTRLAQLDEARKLVDEAYRACDLSHEQIAAMLDVSRIVPPEKFDELPVEIVLTRAVAAYMDLDSCYRYFVGRFGADPQIAHYEGSVRLGGPANAREAMVRQLIETFERTNTMRRRTGRP